MGLVSLLKIAKSYNFLLVTTERAFWEIWVFVSEMRLAKMIILIILLTLSIIFGLILSIVFDSCNCYV